MSTASLTSVPPVANRKPRADKQAALHAAIGGARGVADVDTIVIYEVPRKGQAAEFHYRYGGEQAPRRGVAVHTAKLKGRNWLKQS